MRGKGTTVGAATDEPLRPRDKVHSTEIRAQMKKKKNRKLYVTKVTTEFFFKKSMERDKIT